MSQPTVQDPFSDDLVEEVHLSNAPLLRVLAQVRFPKTPDLATDSGINHLHTRIKKVYPILRNERRFNLVVSTEGVTPQQAQQESIWRLHDKEDVWKVYAADDFITLETTQYESRDNFFTRFQELLVTVGELYEPILFDRLGVRYINRLEAAHVEALDHYIRPELLGGPLLAPSGDTQVVHCLTQARYLLGQEQLDARWGLLSPGAMFDPAIPASPERTWILDLDISSIDPGDFNADELAKHARRYAQRAYTFFIWATTPELRKEVGKLN